MSGPVKCLLVDDLEENLLVLEALMRDEGVELLLAQSGTEALNLLLEHDVALALVDVQMPEMDGFELAELMRGSERTRHVPIIFVTAGVREPHRVFRGYESGAVDFLFKPVDPTILRNKAGVFFELYRQRQQIAQDLQERTETLRLSEMFMAVLGHDLRLPLNAMVTSAQAISIAAAEPPMRDAAKRIVSSGMRMNRMIADLLDLARARLGGAIPLSKASVDVMTIVGRVVAEVKEVHPDRAVDVHPSGNTTASVDADRLAQVLSNLIGNALQHGDPSEPVTVTIDGGAAHALLISVRNRGTIDRHRRDVIFDPFRTASDPGTRTGGLGLGLYIARQLMRAHGGELTLVTDDPERTVFVARLPR